MNRCLTFITLFLSISTAVIAQEEDGEFLTPPHRVQPKIGGAVGFTQNFLFIDLGPINDVLEKSFCAPFDDQPMFLLGGQGYGYIMLVSNLRIGGLGASGSMISKSVDTVLNVSREVELSAGFGGVTIEYALPIVPRLDVSLGMMLGGGSTNIKITRNIYPDKIWGDIWDEVRYGTETSEYTRNLSGSFFVYQPSVNIEYAVLRWIGIRLGVSYSGMVGGDWKFDGKYDLIGAPDNLSGSGFMLNGGIFLGTFMY